MALQEPLMKKSSFAEIFIPLLGNSLFAVITVSSVRVYTNKRIEENRCVVLDFRSNDLQKSNTIYIYQWSQRHSQWIANTWNDYWQRENLHGQIVSFKWMNITSQNDATVFRYTFSYKRAIRPGTNTTANLYELERASRLLTTSCLGIKRVINNKPEEIFPFPLFFILPSLAHAKSRIKK